MNTFWVPSERLPYAPVYYPSSAAVPSRAAVISVKDNEQVSDLVFTLPSALSVKTIPVFVTWPDGTPVEDANVWLSEKEKPWSVVGISVSHTEANGHFDLKGLAGRDYILFADKYSDLGRDSCAKPILVEASVEVQRPVHLVLNVTDFQKCQDFRDKVPTKKLQ